MAGVKKTTWIGGTVFLAIVIVVGAWFLVIGPTRATAAETRAQAAATEQSNELVALQLTKLRADFVKLPEYKADLAALQLQIPTTPMLSEYLRQVDQIAAAHAVTVTTISPSVPAAVVLVAPTGTVAAAPAPAPTDGSTAPADGSTGAVAAAPTGPTAPVDFTGIPFAMTVIGSYDNTIAFLSDLQNATPRLFLVTGLTATAQHEAPASGGHAATHEGDMELAITGTVYALPDPLAAPVVADPNATPPALPGAVPGKNPLVPITGN